MRLFLLASLAAPLALALPSRPAGAEERLLLHLEGASGDDPRVARFRVDEPIAVRLDSDAGGRKRAPRAWLVERSSRRVVWTSAESPAQDSGGKRTKRAATLELPPGEYLLHLLGGRKKTGLAWHLFGDVHRAGRGEREPSVSIWGEDEVQPHLTLQREDSPPAESIVRLAPLKDDQFLRERFRLLRPAPVRIVASGELAWRSGEFVDQSWLLELETRRVVWSLAEDSPAPGGGSDKNRAADRELSLAQGAYELVAVTDSSHSHGGWNAAAPRVPEDWGVTVTGPEGLLSREGLPAEKVLLRLPALEDSQDSRALFRIDRETLLRVHGIGEWSSSEGRMADFGSIEREGGGEIWKMEYDASRPAGGADKQRSFDQSLRLPPGRYIARYVSDDSHSKGRPNADPPPERESWGLVLSSFEPAPAFTLLELRAEAR